MKIPKELVKHLESGIESALNEEFYQVAIKIEDEETLETKSVRILFFPDLDSHEMRLPQ